MTWQHRATTTSSCWWRRCAVRARFSALANASSRPASPPLSARSPWILAAHYDNLLVAGTDSKDLFCAACVARAHRSLGEGGACWILARLAPWADAPVRGKVVASNLHAGYGACAPPVRAPGRRLRREIAFLLARDSLPTRRPGAEVG